MRIHFWGTRGSIPTPGRGTTGYGGNTSCVELRAEDGTVVVLDCGTGARPLGAELLARDRALPPIHILVSHTHWDHIQGFPFFLPAYVAGSRLAVYGARGVGRTLESSLSGQMQQTYFPIQLDELRAELQFEELGEERFQVGPYRATSQLINHTTATLGYRLEGGGVSVAYITDHEPFWWEPTSARECHRFRHPGEARHLAFVAGADVLIHDAQYADDEYPARRGWGHSTVEYAVDLAVRGGVKQLVLFHHDPTHGDAWIRRQLARARRRAAAQGSDVEIVAAAEGGEIHLQEHGAVATTVDATLPPTTGRIVIVGGDRALVEEVHEALAADHDEITELSEHELAAAGGTGSVDLLILAGPGNEAALLERAAEVRAASWGARVPIIVLATTEGPGAAGWLADSATDVLSRPFNPAMLRPRVRAWLARTGRRVERCCARQPRRLAAQAAEGDLLRGIPVSERAALLGAAILCRFRPGEVLFSEGDPAGGIYFIRHGRVEITMRLPGGGTKVLGTASDGDTVGELAALDGGPRTATVRALAPTIADYVARDVLEPCLAAAPRVAYRLMHQMAASLRRTDGFLGELTLHRE